MINSEYLKWPNNKQREFITGYRTNYCIALYAGAKYIKLHFFIILVKFFIPMVKGISVLPKFDIKLDFLCI